MPVLFALFPRFSVPVLLIANLASLISASLPAHAQNSGGGWVARQNPNAAPYVPGAVYDWTGRTITKTTVSSTGTTNSTTSPFYISYFTIGDNVGGSTNRSISYSLGGASTYQWLWTPTGSNVGAPAPSLYVLAKGSGGASLGANSAGHTNGLSGTATFNFTSSVPAYTLGPVMPVTQYKVLAAPGSPIASVALGPTLTAAMSGTAGDVGYCSVSASTTAFPIDIAAPDPMGRPDLGDGSKTNQIVYGAQQPDGYLYVPGAFQAAGGTSTEANWLINNSPIVSASGPVDLKIENPAIPNAFTHQWAVSGSTVYVNTPQDTNNPYPQYVFNHWIFKGLPSNNSVFGNHNVNLYVQGKKSQTAKIQTFFSGTASNWPNSDGYTPNWYEYYQQVAPLSILYNPLLTSVGQCEMNYLFNHNTKQYTIVSQTLAMGPKAAQYSPVPAFEVGPSGFIQVAGKVNIKGILSYLYVNGHEVGHQEAYDQRVEVPYIDGSPPAGVTDSDGDGIPDAWEIAHHLDPEDPDTGKYYTQTNTVDEGKGDRESLATIKGLGLMVQSASLWQQDWADLGIQYGKRPAYVPFEYDPLEISQSPSNSLSSNVLTDWP